MGPLLGVVFHENTSRKSKFRLKGAELFPPQFYSSIAPMNALLGLIGQHFPSERFRKIPPGKSEGNTRI